MTLDVAETSFVEPSGRMMSAAATASDVNLSLSPPLCHSSPATAAVTRSDAAVWSPRYQYGSTAPGVAMTTFRCDVTQPSRATGNGRRLPGWHVDDDVSRCQLQDVESVCPTCTATRYCQCCSRLQTVATYSQRVADV